MKDIDSEIINKVWEKGEVVPNYDSTKYRKDLCGAWIVKDRFGDTASIYGWQVDYIKPQSLGGADSIENFQPMQWQNNANKTANYPQWYCKVTSVDNKNEEIIPPSEK